MASAGVRGIRLNLATGGVSDPAAARPRFERAVARVKSRNWHVQIYTNLATISAITDLVAVSPVPVVFDHFGGARAELGPRQPGFAELLNLVRSGRAYVKISGAYRSSNLAPDYADVVPLAQALIAANPERIVWGTDWPHPNSASGRKATELTPLFQIDDGRLLNQLPVWAPEAATRARSWWIIQRVCTAFSLSGGSLMTLQEASTKPQVAIMNAVHDLPVLVARDAGFFKDEGLDLEFVTTPGMAQITTSHFVKFDSVLRPPARLGLQRGGIDQYRMCEWGIMKRAVEADSQGLRGRKIVALGASMSMFAVVVSRDSRIYEPEMLKDKPIAVTPNNGSEFTTLKMMEGFLAPEHVKRIHAGSMLKRLEAVRDGKVAAASLMEPWISVAQKWGLRILIESHSTRAEAAATSSTARRSPRCFARRRARSSCSKRTRRLTRTTWRGRPEASSSPTSCRPGASFTPRRSPTLANGSTTPTTGR